MEREKVDRQQILRRIVEIRNYDTNPEKLGELIDAWERNYGPDYNEIAGEILAEHLTRNAKAWVKEHNLSTAADIIRDMWEGWTEGEFTVDRTKEGIQIRCTKCPHADAYLAIDRKDYGVLFKCNEDFAIYKAYPDVFFRRTKTLMEGDDCCDHFFSDKEK
ncbi:MAG: L-2-amino-thiazoline-4-carboxylic acid hydrolase [Candidatus Thorarchaeota archaeon]